MEILQYIQSYFTNDLGNQELLTTTGLIGPEENDVYRNLFHTDLFIDRQIDEFCCSICLTIMNDPVQVNCPSQHMYCRLCITNWLKTRKQCPLDRQTVRLNEIRSVPSVRRLIDGLRLHCPNQSDGCTLTAIVSDMRFHIYDCSRGQCGTVSTTPSDLSGQEIAIRVLYNGQPRYTIKAYDNDLVIALKRRIGDREVIKADEVTIIFQNRPLTHEYNNRTLKECNIIDGSVVWSARRSHGGIDYLIII